MQLVCAEDAEGADIARDLRAHRFLQNNFRDLRGEVAKEPVALALRRAIDDVGPLREAVEEQRDFLGRMLEVVVDGDDDFAGGGADAAEERVVLAVVSQERNAAHLRVFAREFLDDAPTPIAARVIDHDDLQARGTAGEHGLQPLDERRQRVLAIIDGDDDGDRRHGIGWNHWTANAVARLSASRRWARRSATGIVL